MTRYEDTDEFASMIALIYYAQRQGRTASGLSLADIADLSAAWCELSDDGALLPARRARVARVATREEFVAAVDGCFQALLEAAPTLVDVLRVARAREYVRMLPAAA